MNRWEYLEGVKPETPVRVALRELCKVLTKELLAWPPTMEWTSEATRQHYANLYAPGARRPSMGALEQALLLVGWDLARDFDAIEYYERNSMLQRACPDSLDRTASRFITLYLLEGLLGIIEKTDHRIRRKDVVDCLDELGAMLTGSWLSPSGDGLVHKNQ